MNTVVVASAGSGKTTRLVTEAADLKDARILITTYTNENVANIRECLIEKLGCVPANVSVASWYSVLLEHGVRPYQNLVAQVPLPRATKLVENMPEWVRRTPKAAVERYYFTKSGDIYLDRVSDFVCLVDERTNGLVLDRLSGIFTHVFIDEIQDLNGWDLDLLERLFRSDLTVLAVGDPRQGTYTTNRGSKNKAVARSAIVDWIDEKERAGLVHVEELAESWRSNQLICDFADGLYPHHKPAVSKNDTVTDHDGVFVIGRWEAQDYFAARQPIVLRWNKAADTLGLPATNIGLVKGRSFDRVMIFPTAPMKAYLEKKDPSIAGDLAKFYVAVTRARYSVTFVV